MPHIDSTSFGQITVDGVKYHQILIVGNSVEERDYDRLTGLFGTSHRIGDWEKDKLFEEKPTAIIVGTGVDGMLRLDGGFIKKAGEAGVDVISALTPEAVRIYNDKTARRERVNALIHTTC